MNRLHVSSLLATLGAVSLAVAQAQQVQQPPNQKPQQQQPADPRPSTGEAEGTAADSTPPDQTDTRTTRPDETQVDPRPSTTEAEGTAADTTPPGGTPTTPRAGTKATAQASELRGAPVVTSSDAKIGQVVDVVVDSAGQPTFVVISSQGEAAAVPYSVASSMMSGNKVVIDASRLKSAPKIREGEWRRGQPNSAWQRDATRYWEQS